MDLFEEWMKAEYRRVGENELMKTWERTKTSESIKTNGDWKSRTEDNIKENSQEFCSLSTQNKKVKNNRDVHYVIHLTALVILFWY